MRSGLLRASARGAKMLLAGSRAGATGCAGIRSGLVASSSSSPFGAGSQRLMRWAVAVNPMEPNCARAFGSSVPETAPPSDGVISTNKAELRSTVRTVLEAMSEETGTDDDDWHIDYSPPFAILEQPAPDFEAQVATPDMEIENFALSSLRGKWVVFFFYPKDFTFVCPSEIIAFSDAAEKFRAINTEIVACSTDTAEVHLAWMRTPRAHGGLGKMDIKIVADQTKSISAKYGVLKEDAGVAFRGLFIIAPDGVLKQITLNNLDIGRSVDETLRLVQALQFVAENGVVCPAGWKPGDKVMKGSYEGSREYFAEMYGGEGSGDMVEMAPSLKKLTTPEDIKKALASDQKVVLDYYADFCGKCKQLAPTLEKLAKQHTGIKVYKVDTEAPALKEKLADDVTALPTLRFYKGGSQVNELVGYKPNKVTSAFEEL
ncbi:Peroxiredoxin-1 [Porphyridium purpureum]|uniref:thioredoxin-dependent peroxiredoxin n=1 Tax=Porphyridium purpureum TaxID=35688 RepID=A0A5J4Z0V9_PORPP|nr:Peroxiredoxin-1 [Porphyridium purpureum]|eukprot:POR0755..scf208_2